MKKTDRIAYPVFIKQDGDYYLAYIPDYDTATEGFSFADAIYMARDAIGLSGIVLLDDGKPVPNPSSAEQAILLTKQHGDMDEFVYSDGTLTYVDIDFDEYRKSLDEMPDDYDRELMAEANAENDGQTVTLEEVRESLGLANA